MNKVLQFVLLVVVAVAVTGCPGTVPPPPPPPSDILFEDNFNSGTLSAGWSSQGTWGVSSGRMFLRERNEKRWLKIYASPPGSSSWNNYSFEFDIFDGNGTPNDPFSIQSIVVNLLVQDLSNYVFALFTDESELCWGEVINGSESDRTCIANVGLGEESRVRFEIRGGEVDLFMRQGSTGRLLLINTYRPSRSLSGFAGIGIWDQEVSYVYIDNVIVRQL